MVTKSEVLRQFRQLKVKPNRLAKPEIDELANTLAPGECLTHVVFGWYENGFGLLCCTEHRVILIDKKLFYLKLEELRYDKISDIKFLHRLLDAAVIFSYAGITLEFKSWNQSGLRNLTSFVQQAITIINSQLWQITEDSPGSSRPMQIPSMRQAPVEPQPTTTVGINQGISYPDELMQQASVDLGLMKNPYAPTNKFIRRRVPLYGFNQSSR